MFRTISLILSMVMLVTFSAGPGLAYAAQEEGIPAVQIIAPEEGCTANSGEKLDILIITAENLDIVSVSALCDARGIGMTTAKPYVIKWDTAGIEPGAYVVRAFAYLKTGERLAAKPVSITLASAKSPATAPSATVKEGTPVALETAAKLVSGETAEGSTVRYRVVRDVLGPDDQILIPYGSPAYGKVTKSIPRGMFGKSGKLEFTVKSVKAADGTLIPLRATQDVSGRGNGGAVIVTALFLSVLGLFINGRDAVIPEGTAITAYVDNSTGIGKPLPASPGAAENTAADAVTIQEPENKSRFKERSKIDIAFDVSTNKKITATCIMVDDKIVTASTVPFTRYTWDTRGLRPGSYAIVVETTLDNGDVIKSAPVNITIKKP